jgi:hypothetical protein
MCAAEYVFCSHFSPLESWSKLYASPGTRRTEICEICDWQCLKDGTKVKDTLCLFVANFGLDLNCRCYNRNNPACRIQIKFNPWPYRYVGDNKNSEWGCKIHFANINLKWFRIWLSFLDGVVKALLLDAWRISAEDVAQGIYVWGLNCTDWGRRANPSKRYFDWHVCRRDCTSRPSFRSRKSRQVSRLQALHTDSSE